MPCLRFPAALAAALVVALVSPAAFGYGQPITDVRIRDNVRTHEDTIRAIAGVAPGDTLESDTLELVRERLNNSGLFADINVFWEPHKSGARVVITVREKFPWAPVPTFSRSPGELSFGAILVHGNLWGRGKQGVVGGRISNVNSGAVLAYRDPALFGSWFYWQFEASFNQRAIPEFSMDESRTFDNDKLRNTRITSYGTAGTIGVFWWRRVRTEFRWSLARFDVGKVYVGDDNVQRESPAEDATRGFGQVKLHFDFRAKEHAVVTGNSFAVFHQIGNKDFLSSDKIDFWKFGADYEHGMRFFRRHNWINSASIRIGKDLPLWDEMTGGGMGLRGFRYEQFRGDSAINISSEYTFPLLSIASLDFRGALFYDAQAIWWRDLPNGGVASNGRRYLGPGTDTFEGFKFPRDFHQGVGAGLRFFLRSVAVPLVGVDMGYGIEDDEWRLTLLVGAPM